MNGHFRIKRGIRAGAFMLALFVAFSGLGAGCGTTENAETSTNQYPANIPCDESHEACKDRCRQPENANSQGACFNQCLRSLQACRDR